MGHSCIRLNSLLSGLSSNPATALRCSLRDGTKVRAGLPDQLAGEMKEISIAGKRSPGPIHLKRALIKRAVCASKARRGDLKW